MIRGIAIIIVGLVLITLSGCAYYNFFYNAQKSFEVGEEKRKDVTESQNSRSKPGQNEYQKAIESAGRMLEYYPDSRWEDDALLLLAKAYYHVGKFRNAIGKVDELTAKYPTSELLPEGMLWKGISLLKVNQPDSARAVLLTLYAPEIDQYLGAQAHFALAEYYYDDERWVAALEEYRQILKIQYKDDWMHAQVLVKVGDCLKYLGQNEDALSLYEDVLASKPSRALRFTSKLQQAIVLRELGRYDDAMDLFRKLLRDGAFIEQFPRVELETARCERKMGEYEKAMERLDKLVESEKRGAIVAEAQWERGLIFWQVRNELMPSVEALREVKSADRNSEWVVHSDSLLSRIETLSKYWQRIEYLQNQRELLSSALRLEFEMFPSDTIFVDSISIKLNTKPQRERANKRRGRNEPLMRMIEDARNAEEDEFSDSLDASAEDTIAPFDSTALEILLFERHKDLISEYSKLAGYYLFNGTEKDSSVYFFKKVMDYDSLATDLKIRTLGSLSYLAMSDGDTAAHDSLLNIVLGLNPDEVTTNRIYKRLGMEMTTSAKDPLIILIDEAEKLWIHQKQPATARDYYLQIAAKADSTSDLRARVLLAAAFISMKALGEDSTARVLYEQVKEEFSGSEYARVARDKVARINKHKPPPEPEPEPEPEPDPEKPMVEDALAEGMPHGLPEDFPFEDFMGDEPEAVERRVYNPEDADDLPEMAIPIKVFNELINNTYPFEFLGQDLEVEVWVEFVVEPSGNISDLQITSMNPDEPEFEDATRKVMEIVRYKPGRVKGKISSIRMKQKILFKES